MAAAASLVRSALRYVGSGVLSLAVWTLWLGLGLLATLQVYIAFRSELSVPAFILRQLEGQIEKAGARVTFERATFDPTGRVLVEHPQAFLQDYSDPVITARAAYISLNPWSVLVGRFEPKEIRLIGGAVLVPAMLSPSGTSEAIVSDLDGYLTPGDGQLVFRHVSARVGSMVLSVHGAVALPASRPSASGELQTVIRARFRDFCRAAVDFTGRLAAFDEPAVDLELFPSNTRGAIVRANLAARALKIDSPIVATIGGFRATTRFPLSGDAPAMSRLDLTASEVHLLNAIDVRHLSAAIRGRLRPGELRVDPVVLEVAAGSIVTADVTATDFSATLLPGPLPVIRGDAVAEVFNEPVFVRGQASLKEHTATVHLAGSISPSIIEIVKAHSRVDVRRYFDFATLNVAKSTAEFGPDWKFQHASADVALTGIKAYGVTMQEGHATVYVDRTHLFSPDAYARVGENFAQGTYEHEFASRQFRFLLNGRLRPLDISPWFRGQWWTSFFSQFEFPKIPPAAMVDVQGRWGNGRRASVFIFADADAPTILGQKLGRVRTRLFVRPGFYDGLETHVFDPAGGHVDGTFNVTTHLGSGKWRTIDVDGQSTLSFAVAKGLAGPLGRTILDPFQLDSSPALKMRGHFDGPAMPEPRHRRFDLEARTTGNFRFYNFPLQDVVFTAAVRDDELTLDNILGKFAGGSVRGHAKVWGSPPNQRLGFDAAINDASFGRAVTAVQTALAERKGQPPPAPGKFVQEKTNVRLDLAASAEGIYGNALSYHGDGNVALRGAEIGEVPLLGLLSQLLKFTALRFTTARSTFKIDGAKLEFPEVALRGANSAIDAKGDYALDRRQLDFRAKVFPFQESGNVIKTVVGAVLAPISNVLEVKLTGTLEKPDWAFVIGPTNLLRSIAPTESKAAPASPTAGSPADDRAGPRNQESSAKPPSTPTEATAPTPVAPPAEAVSPQAAADESAKSGGATEVPGK